MLLLHAMHNQQLPRFKNTFMLQSHEAWAALLEACARCRSLRALSMHACELCSSGACCVQYCAPFAQQQGR
jgi:hypothetical protein